MPVPFVCPRVGLFCRYLGCGPIRRAAAIEHLTQGEAELLFFAEAFAFLTIPLILIFSLRR